jgi:hypothetical protein
MARHLMPFAAILMEPQPAAAALLKIVRNLEGDDCTDASERVAHQPPISRSRRPLSSAVSIYFSSWRISAPESTGVLPRVTIYFGPRTEPAGVDVRMPPVTR